MEVQQVLEKNRVMHDMMRRATVDALDLQQAAEQLQEKIAELVKKKCALSDAAKAKVKEYCVAAEKSANPQMEDDEITGNYKNIDDMGVLEKLERQLLAVRK